MVRVFCDASSAILLEKAGLFLLAAEQFQLVVPPSVLTEITIADTPDAARFAEYAGQKKLHVTAVPDSSVHNMDLEHRKLDTGERDVIRLYLHQKKGFILTDDGQAAKWCRFHSLPFINALLVPKVFWYAGLIDQEACKEHMHHISKLGRYSETVKAIATACTRNDLALFLPGN